MQRITVAVAGILSCALAACGDVSTISPDAARAPVTLTVTKVGAGRVTSAPVGIDCGTACSDDFTAGQLGAWPRSAPGAARPPAG